MSYIDMCNKSTHPKQRHACIIFYNGHVVAWANNMKSPNEGHAEMRALYIAYLHNYKKDLVLLSLRVTKTGNLAMAKPCPGCLAYIKRTKRVKKILYSNPKGVIVKYEDDLEKSH